MARQRFDTAPEFRVADDSVVIQQVAGSSAPLLELKDHSGSTLITVHSTGQMTATVAPSFVSASLTGTPTAPTAAAGTNTTQVATTEFVRTELSNLVDAAPSALDTLNELAAALGDDANFATTVTNALADKAPLNSPALTGTPTAPNPITGDNSAQIATTAFANALVEAFLPAGMISPYAGSSAPSGWLLCAGQTVSRTTYSRLFSALGTTYNIGEEAGTDFRLPDLRGRTIAGVDNMGGSAASRLSSATISSGADALGRVGGAETHVLTEAQLASHTHVQNSHNHTQNEHTHANALTGSTVFASSNHTHPSHGSLHAAVGATNSDAGRIAYIAGGVYANPSTYSIVGGGLVVGQNFNHNTPVYGDTGGNSANLSVGLSNAGQTATNQAQTATNQNTGSNSAHNNVQPTMVLNYIIKA